MQSRISALIVDEMHIQEKLHYSNQQDAFVGHTMGLVKEANMEPVLANSLLHFINRLSTAYRIPLSYFFR